MRRVEGGEGVMGAMIRAGIRVDRGLAGGLQALLGAPMAACSGCDDRNGGIGHSKRRSRTRDGASWRFGWPVGESVAEAPSGWEWNGTQPGQGATELGFPGPAPEEMQSEAARRAGELPAREKNRRRRVLVVTICSPRPEPGSSGPGCGPSPGPPARRRWREAARGGVG